MGITKVNILSKALPIGLKVLILFILTMPLGAIAEPIVDDSFDDFSLGILDASGQNLYVSKDGSVRAIHGHDLNDDGWIDLVFPQTHDYKNMVPASTGVVDEHRRIITKTLLVEGALEARTADLNNDGWQDLVFCPNKSGIQNSRRFITIIYGGDDGWPASRSNGQLPVNSIVTLELADLNADGFQDIVTLNSSAWLPGQPDGNILRVYWGSADGFLMTRYTDAGVEGAISLASGDFDGDEITDLAVLRRDGFVEVFWAGEAQASDLSSTPAIESSGNMSPQRIRAGDIDDDGHLDLLLLDEIHGVIGYPGKNRRDWGPAHKLSDHPASEVAVGDLDIDGRTDLAVVSFVQARAAGGELSGIGDSATGSVHITWSVSTESDADAVSDVAADNVSSIAIGDYDGDGNMDLATAIYQGEFEFETDSKILFGDGERGFENSSGGVVTQGAYHALTIPAENNKPDRVVFSSISAGTVDERVPSIVYWGGETGFSEENRLDIPFRTGYEATIADFNVDGITDLMLLSQSGDLDHPWTGANIFYGDVDGVNLESRTVLPEVFLGSSNVADLNKDGYLDIVLGHYFSDAADRMDTDVFIYFGGASGFTSERRVTLPSYGRSLSIQLADFDKDSWLDIAVNSYKDQGVRIFYGSKEGFESSRRAVIDAPAVADLETADLNGDGWLDLIACSYRDFEDHHHDLGFNIFWGSSDGFQEWNAQWLSGYAPLGPTVADWNDDGYLDLFVANYHGETTREDLPAFLYWSGPDGFHPDRRTSFISDSAADALAADFDKDGRLDIAITNHTADGSHPTESKVYYNDGHQFASARVESLPTRGPHWGVNEDLGHIYDRSWRQDFESSVFSIEGDETSATLEYDADLPAGTELRFLVRSSESSGSLASAAWSKLEGGNFSIETTDRYLQYKAIFVSDNGSRYPVLNRVQILVGD